MPGMITRLCVSILAAAIGSLPAAAEYTGPGGVEITTVAQILESPGDDDKVVIKGFIMEMVSKETYVFTDGTGEIQVEIDDEDLPVEPIDERTQVEITGEVDTDVFRKPEIDVDTVRIIRE